MIIFPYEPRGPRREPHVIQAREVEARRELRAMGMLSNDPRKWTGRARLIFRYGRRDLA